MTGPPPGVGATIDMVVVCPQCGMPIRVAVPLVAPDGDDVDTASACRALGIHITYGCNADGP